jgi:xanthine/CO dehydrogenase XdhC/CoxF family maturation factor
MKELSAILAALEQARGTQQHAVLATLVGVKGSSYRRPGARMLILGDCRVGAISGGCLENDVAQRSQTQQPGQPPRIIRYATGDSGEAILGFGMGCKGALSILLESIDPAAEPPHIRFLRECLISGQTGVLATVCALEGDGPVQVGHRLMARDGAVTSVGPWPADISRCITEEAWANADTGGSRTQSFQTGVARLEIFIEMIRPPLRLVVFGAGDNALPVVRLAGELGWQVTVCDRRDGLATADRFPLAKEIITCPLSQIARRLSLEKNTAAIVMTHHYPDDLELLRLLLPCPLGYLGILGARARTRQLLDDLAKSDPAITDQQLLRLHHPIGLDIGGDAPEEVALSIVAEIQAVIHGRTGGFLRGRAGAIHQPISSETARP